MVAFNPETQQVGLNTYEVRMAFFGFAGKLLGSPNRETLLSAQQAQSDLTKEFARRDVISGQLVWVNATPSMLDDLGCAIEDWRVNNPGELLGLKGYKPAPLNAPERRIAELESTLALEAIAQIKKIRAALPAAESC